MSEGTVVKRLITFTHQSHQSPVDIIPMGFRLFGPTAHVEEMFLSYQLSEGDLVLLCLTDTVFLEDDANEMPVQEVRPFLRAHYERIRSQPLRWRVPVDLYDEEQRVEFDFSVRHDLPKRADRVELLEFCFRKALDGTLPRWFMALKDDIERHVPAYYRVEIAYGDGAVIHQFDWPTWQGGRRLIGLEDQTTIR